MMTPCVYVSRKLEKTIRSNLEGLGYGGGLADSIPAGGGSIAD